MGVWEGLKEEKKTKMTLDTGGKSVSKKSQVTPGLQEPLLEIKKKSGDVTFLLKKMILGNLKLI
jgi:hypothetical protein